LLRRPSTQDSRNVADIFVAEVARAVAERMTATGLRGEDLRERLHLDPFTKDECERRCGVRPLSTKLTTPAFPGLGAVDVILTRPRALIELKWAYYSPGKIYESLWDAVKLALLGPAHSYAALYVGTGALRAEWGASESADLFTGAEIDPREFWERPLRPRGPNYGKTIGEDLIIGARGNRPRKMHRRIAIRPVATCEVAGDFELRVVGIAGIDPVEDWSPDDAVPCGVPPEPDLESVELPARVTQAWIERTAPRLKPVAIRPFLRDLQVRGWSDGEIEERVRPHLCDAR